MADGEAESTMLVLKRTVAVISISEHVDSTKTVYSDGARPAADPKRGLKVALVGRLAVEVDPNPPMPTPEVTLSSGLGAGAVPDTPLDRARVEFAKGGTDKAGGDTPVPAIGIPVLGTVGPNASAGDAVGEIVVILPKGAVGEDGPALPAVKLSAVLAANPVGDTGREPIVIFPGKPAGDGRANGGVVGLDLKLPTSPDPVGREAKVALIGKGGDGGESDPGPVGLEVALATKGTSGEDPEPVAVRLEALVIGNDADATSPVAVAEGLEVPLAGKGGVVANPDPAAVRLRESLARNGAAGGESEAVVAAAVAIPVSLLTWPRRLVITSRRLVADAGRPKG